MFDIIIKNLTQRKLRTGLTVFGIALGIFAVMVMGGMSEYFRLHVDRTFDLMTDKIQVWPESGFVGGTLDESTIRDIRRVPGVSDSYGLLWMPYDMESIGLFGSYVMGINPDKQETTLQDTGLEEGRYLLPGDRLRAVVGSNVARQFNLRAGDELEIKSRKLQRGSSITHIREFTVVGIMEFTGTDYDYVIAIPLDTAQDFYDIGRTVSYILVIPETGVDPENLAKRIELSVSNIKAFSPQELREQVAQSLVIINLITLSAALIAAVIGGLSVMNTMLMSVSERTKDFGLFKAMGAGTRDILVMTVGESALMGILGGIIGIAGGSVFIYYMNEFLISKGVVLFAITPELVVVAMMFATLLGTVSGVIPAYRAAKMSPMEALRYE
ncbi:MAG: ABC transporter permease [Candidatus Methanoperedenaceae archaeon]|nr:ABC transporter permease [Candidatus Methanoperedenaceae archaeon]